MRRKRIYNEALVCSLYGTISIERFDNRGHAKDSPDINIG